MALERSHSAKSDTGLKRQHNEDRFVVDPRLGLYVICDGMGGNNAGEIAGALAVRAIHTHLAKAAKDADLPLIGPGNAALSNQANRLASAIHAANHVIYRESWRRLDYAGMGTTVVAALLHEEVLAIAHVGDSRLYLVRNGTIQSLTTDHSWVAEQILTGFITEEEAERSPSRNIVTRALGVESSVDVELAEVSVKNGDRLLLCSDGLTRAARSKDILPILSGSEDLAAMSDRLIAMANEAGGDDNTTVIIVALGGEFQTGLWERLKKRFVA
ncbi:MAG: Stp1/IreP family PP2C-type Ser/Thr phosphatase [Nitrospirae bacterium]|nr:Stp1/IreP family PP2C-type Ser/Thr phosphatase [Nitrospirota bacterium]